MIDVAPGEIVAVVGANGAGKTTLLDALAREAPRHGTARVLQRPSRYVSLTVGELVRLSGGDGELLARFGLSAYADRAAGELSTGQKRLVELACAAAREPSLLLLDEPAAGLAAGETAALAEALRAWRDRGRTAIVLVEHDAALVAAVADRVYELEDERLVAQAPPAVSLDTTLDAVAAARDHTVHVPERALSTWTLLRLGLRELAAGALSVLVLGVLNRVMAVEYGVPLVTVALLLGAYNLAAPLALLAGHRSDSRPFRGRHRAPYVVGGAALAGVAAVLAPHAARLVATRPGMLSTAVALAVFVLLGAGMYGGGAAWFALLADLTPEQDRARASAVVYSMLMAGVLAGAGLSAVALDDGGRNVSSLFAVVAVLLVVASAVAVRGLDRVSVPAAGDVRSAFRALARKPGTLRFFGFLVVATLALLAQQAVLEPFGGEVLGLGVRLTSLFNAVQVAGVLAGMFAGSRLARSASYARIAVLGLVVAAAGFAGLAVTALTAVAPLVWFAVAVMGFGAGLVSVGSLALMLGATVPGHVAASMALWTVAHALADGLATVTGGVLHDVASRAGASRGTAYAAVFAVEGLLALAAATSALGRSRSRSG